MSLTAASVRPTLKTALEAAAPFAAAGVKAIAFEGDVEANEELENAIKTKGMVLALAPLLASRNSSKASTRLLERAVFAVNIRTNPTINADAAKGGSEIDHDVAGDAVIRVLLALGGSNGALPELEPGNGDLVRQLMPSDAGLRTTAVYFSVPLTLSPP